MKYKVTDISNNEPCGEYNSLQEAIQTAKEMTYNGEFKIEVYHYELNNSNEIKTVTDWKNR